MQNASPSMNYGQRSQDMSFAQLQSQGLISQTTRQLSSTLDSNFMNEFTPATTTPNFAASLAQVLHPPPATEDDQNQQ